MQFDCPTLGRIGDRAMNFRIIKKQFIATPSFQFGRWSRRLGLTTLVCTVIGTSVLAQTAFEFVDPLDDERTRIEKATDAPETKAADRWKPSPRADDVPDENAANLLTRARESANTGAAAAQQGATGFWGRIRAAMSEIADSIGLSTGGLLGLLGGMLAVIALLVGWTLFRGRRNAYNDPDEDIYAPSKRSNTKRRQPGDKLPAASMTARSSEREPIRESAATGFEETMPEDFDSIFAEENVDWDDDETDVRAETASSQNLARPDARDTSTWRKPNLSRLRDSIKADWKADKEDARATTESPRSTAATPFATPADPGERGMAEISDGWEDWDEQAQPGDDPWGTAPATADDTSGSEDAAMRRIRALRESLRAS